MKRSQTINHLINQLVSKVVNAKTKRQIDTLIATFYKALDGFTVAYKKELIKEATSRAMKLGLSKQEAIRISHLRNIISSRYDKNGKMIRTALDMVEAFNSVPKNVTKDAKSVIIAWQMETDKYLDLGKLMLDAGVARKADRNYELLTRNWNLQVDNDARLELIADDVPIRYIAQEDEENRSDVCHQLHGTIWLNKSQIPEWAKPLIHLNCKCKLVSQDDVENVTITVKGIREGRRCTKPKWLKSGQSISRIKKVKGECAYTYSTTRIKK